MANTDVFSHLLSADMYDIADAVNAAKSQYISEDEQTLAMGIFGYIGSIETAKIQSNIVMASELSNEVFPNRAKYDRNIMTHAMMYDILDVNAEPANIHVALYLKKSDIEKYSVDDVFIIDRKCPIYIGDPDDSNSESYEFHLDYNVVLTKVTVNWDEEVYTARYDITSHNNISKITNPYLSAPMTIVLGGETYIGVQVTLSQVSLADTYEKLISSSIIDNKTFIFSHQDQMADFMIYVTENDVTTAITPIYEGATVPQNVDKFCYYLYIDSEKVRVKFERTSYMPGLNAEIEVRMQTTKGYEGNFKYTDSAVFATLSSEVYGYNNVESMVYIQSNSENGLDAKSADELKKIIPKEALSRGAISTSADLNNYFNQLNTENNKIMLSKKVDNQIENTQYAHLLIKDMDNNIVPTNTIKIAARKCDFKSSSDVRFVIPAGAIIELNAETGIGNLIYSDIDENGIEDYIGKDETAAESDEDVATLAHKEDDLDPELRAINDAAKAAVESLSKVQNDPESETKLENGISDYGVNTSSVDIENPPSQDSTGKDRDTIVFTGVDSTQGGAGDKLAFTGDESTVNNPTYKVVDNIAGVVHMDGDDVGNFMYLVTDEKSFEIDENNHKLFYYTNPYTIIINAADELYAAYYLCVIDETKILNYKYINQNSDVQFISNTIKWYRRFLTDPNSYKLDITLTQNLQQDLGLYKEDIVRDDNGNDIVNVLAQKVKTILVLYRNGIAYRYAEGDFKNFNKTNYSFNFQFVLNTNNIILDTENNIRIENLGICGQSGKDYGYFPGNTKAVIYTLVEDGGAGGRHDLDNYISGLNNYTVTNMFEINDGIDFFVNYSGIMSSKVDARTELDETSFIITSLPVIGYKYALNEEMFDAFVNQLNYKKAYIDNANEKMQNPFGVDFKFFNTYGPSKLFTLDNDSYCIDRVNVQLNFRVKLAASHDAYTLDYIKKYIKEEVIEKLNDEYSLHIPNLITNVTNRFRESLVYFEFLGIDDYGPGVQHIYHKEVKYDDPEYINMVPEFINVNLVYDDDLNKTPDINIEVV